MRALATVAALAWFSGAAVAGDGTTDGDCALWYAPPAKAPAPPYREDLQALKCCEDAAAKQRRRCVVPTHTGLFMDENWNWVGDPREHEIGPCMAKWVMRAFDCGRLYGGER